MRTLVALLACLSLATVARAGETWHTVKVIAQGDTVLLEHPRIRLVVNAPDWKRALRRHDGHEVSLQLPDAIERAIAGPGPGPGGLTAELGVVAVRWTETLEVFGVDDARVILHTRAGARVGTGPLATYLFHHAGRGAPVRVCIEDRLGRIAGRVMVVSVEEEVSLEVHAGGQKTGPDGVVYELEGELPDHLREEPGTRVSVRVLLTGARVDGARRIGIGSILAPATSAPAPTRGLVGALPGS